MFGIPTHLLAKVTATEATTAVTLSVNPIVIAALSFTPRHLFLRTSTQATSGNPNLLLRFNNDSGTNYNSQVLYGYSTTTGAWAGTSQTSMSLIGNIDDLSNTFSISETLFPDALSTRTHKSAVSLGGRLEEVVELGVGRWEDTATIASVTCLVDSSTFAAGSTFELCAVDESYLISGGETINTGTAQFDKSSISAADGDLVIIGNLRSDVSSNIEELGLQFNNDSTDGNYIRQRMTGHNNSITGAYSSASNAVSHTAAANADANSFSGFIAQIPNFSDGSNDRIALTLGGGHVSDSDQQLAMMSLRRDNADAINRIGVVARNGSGFLANSMLSIYAVPKGLLTRTELSGDASSVAFTSIPQTYDHLEVTAYVRDDRSATSDDILMSLTPVGGSNDTTDANYDTQLLQGAGSTLTAAQSAADRTVGNISSANETANAFGVLTITLVNYAKTDRHKHSLSVSGRAASATGIYFRSNRWENTAAIEAITFTPSAGSNFVAGSVFQLRGINPPAAAATDIETINGIAAANIEAVN